MKVATDKSPMKLVLRDLFWLVLLVAICSCGSGEARLNNDLKNVRIAYHNYHDTCQKGPTSWEDLAKASLNAEAVQRVRDASYELKWFTGSASILYCYRESNYQCGEAAVRVFFWPIHQLIDGRL